ncbi:MAG: PAS domain-containing protein, partial [Eubacteriales bacterium]|nr:PAS domain-containing protein [Eubacteriales bacterium]
MKKVNLSFMAVMIISLVIILIMNTMAVFAYRDKVISIETRKDNMLSFNIKYTNLQSQLCSNARQYLFTNDEKYKSEFLNLRNSYIKNDTIALEYRVFTREQADDSLMSLLDKTGLTISSQAEYIQFNKQEQSTYSIFLDSFNRLIDLYSSAVNAKDISMITNPNFIGLYDRQANLMAELTRRYVDRLNTLENAALSDQNVLEYSLVAVSFLLLCFATATFYLILRENAYNSYFSKLYNTVVENIDGGIVILDKDYRFDYMNSKYKEIMGITAENPEGKTLYDIFDQNIARTIEEATTTYLSGEAKSDLIIGNQKKNIVYSYFTIEDDRGNIKYVHLIRDATKTEELQAQLRKQL